MSTYQETSDNWVREEFATIELSDARLNRRCQEVADTLAQQVGRPINQACEDWAATKGAYRLYAHEKVTPDQIIAPHHGQTVERMQQHALVLAIQDTTFFNYTHHPATTGLGMIGKKAQKQRGFAMHTTLAVTPKGLPLGLLTQAFFTRPENEPSHTPNECRKQPIEEKESYRWLKALEQTITLSPGSVRTVTVCDREADIYDMVALAEEKKAPLLVRASHDRTVLEAAEKKLRATVARQASRGALTLQLPATEKRPAREAVVSVRFARVKLKPPWRPEQKKLPPVTLQAILVREDNPPADAEAVEWLLLTNVPVDTWEDALEVIGWYCTRWQIEVFHKILKSGCRVESARLKTATRLQNHLALLCVIAWRLHWLTYLNRCEPEQPCTLALTQVEWQALYSRIHRTTTLPEAVPTIRQAVRWIAQLGGFLGRKGDGEPGVTVIWRGWQRLQDIADTWFLVKEQSPRFVGNR